MTTSDTKPITLRATDDFIENFKKYCELHAVNQRGGFEKLLNDSRTSSQDSRRLQAMEQEIKALKDKLDLYERPDDIKEPPMTHEIRLRCTELQKRLVVTQAKKMGMSIAGLARSMMFGSNYSSQLAIKNENMKMLE